ncbi:MAG: hypothetical protein U0234_06810 [Sandaracinus sp.]
MPGLSAILLATPLFGLSLTPPALDGAILPAPVEVVDVAATLPMPELLQADGAVPSPDAAAQAEADRQYTEDVIRRRDIGQVHRALGIATWFAMTANLIVGMMQYSDLYGFGAGQNGNPCATGNGIVLNECSGDPYIHIVSASVTSVLYGGTFLLSLVMPDPNQAAEGPGVFADHLRIHEALRWVHVIGMAAQIVIGAMLSNGVFGDRANNYDVMQAMAATHLAIGWATWGALSASAAIMLF